MVQKDLSKFVLNSENISAQLWRFTTKGHFENKLRSWRHSTSSSAIVPNNLSEGYIEIKDINKVFTLNNKTNVVDFEVKNVNNTVNQKWKLGSKNSEGWQTIQHSSSGQYLTTSYVDKGTKITVENKGIKLCKVSRS